MSLSLANATSVAYNEPTRSTSLFPGYLRENPETKIIELIRYYYEYLNSKDNPSYELENLIHNHDIDEMSDKYLTAIQLQIAKSVPNSVTLDKRRLFKIIAQYYKTRGSEESIHIFFRIFFNEFVTIFYPSSLLFHTSDDQSESSSRFRLQDGERWQKYSYEIRTTNDPTQWKESFVKFVHPAGLKLLIAVIVFCFSENNWDGPLEDFIENLENISSDEYWNNIRLDAILGKHSPTWQPNTDVKYDYLFKVIIDSAYHYRTQTYSIEGVNEEYLYAAVLKLLLDLRLFAYGSTLSFRNEYQSWLKYNDSLRISDGYSNLTINDASKQYLPMNECRFEVMTPQIDIRSDYVSGYVNTTTADQVTLTDWTNSSVEELVLPDASNLYDYTAASAYLEYSSVDDEYNSIFIEAVTPGSSGNSISVTLLSPIVSDQLVTVSIFENNIALTPSTFALASDITDAINSEASHLVNATQYTSDNGAVKIDASGIVYTITLTGGDRNIDQDILVQRIHRPAYIPEADEIVF